MQADVETIGHFGHELAKMLPVAVVAESGRPFIASGGEMIPAAGPLNPERAGHKRGVNSTTAIVNC